MPAQQTAEMMKRLNEAEPTMVNEPSGPTTMFDLRTSGRGLLSWGAAYLTFLSGPGYTPAMHGAPELATRAVYAHQWGTPGASCPARSVGRQARVYSPGGPGAYSSAQG